MMDWEAGDLRDKIARLSAENATLREDLHGARIAGEKWRAEAERLRADMRMVADEARLKTLVTGEVVALLLEKSLAKEGGAE